MKVIKNIFKKEASKKMNKDKKDMHKELAFANFGIAFMLTVFALSHLEKDSLLMIWINIIFILYMLFIIIGDISAFKQTKKEQNESD